MSWIVVIVSILCPPLGIVGGIIGIYKDYNKWKYYILCIALGMASIAYCYIPKGDPDIVRYWDFVESLKNYSFIKALNTTMHGDGNLYVYTAFAWICAQIGDVHLLPACSVFIVYYVGFYITCQVGKDIKAKKTTVIVYIIFIMLALNFYGVVNNVRNICAFALISMAIFREMYQKKYDIWSALLYILPLFIHTSAILLILLRLVVYFSVKIRVILLVWVVNIMMLIDFAFNLFTSIGTNNFVISLIRSMVFKAHFYFHNTTSEWGKIVMNSLSYRIDRYLNITFACIICIFLLWSQKDELMSKYRYRNVIRNVNTVSKKRLELFNNYVFFMAMATIGCLQMIMPEYWRFYSTTVLTASVPFLIMANSKFRYKRIISYVIFPGVLINSIIVLRFLLYSDRFSLLVMPFFSSPLVITIRNILK